MTMHDDPDLQVLERDLTALATPQVRDERLRSALRDELLAAAHPRPQARRRLSVRWALGATGLVAAAAAVAVLAIVGPAGSGGPASAGAAIIHHVLEAVTPPANTILHTQVVGVQNGVTVVGETWQETSAPYASRGVKGPLGHQGESGDNGTTSFEYDPAANTIAEQRDTARPTFSDPVSQIRTELAGGQAQETGTDTIDGVPLYKVELPHGLVAYFQQGDYRPRYLDDPQRDGSVIRLRVAAYDYLPMSSANRALLSVTAQHPSARIVTGAGAAGASGK